MTPVRPVTRRTVRTGAAMLIGALILGLTLGPTESAGSERPTRTDYKPTADSLDGHPVPDWFHDAKFGIFIHWGAYSVPAWGPRGSYAEWYWNYMNSVGSPTHNYHRETYGADAPYDAFIDQWKAERFDADEWIDLFNDAGAKYFVLTSKHHEGVALWDTATSQRDVVDRGPGRDLSAELFDAAREDGRLKAGFYYSLYEWYNPNYTGRPARNPYTGDEVPYTGVEPVDDYVHDYMHPQVRELIQKYDPDILWCDGQWERSAAYWDMAPVIADYYNQAKNRRHPKEVVVANRCKTRTGALDSPELDFQTPEYTVKEDIDPVKWESSRGIAHSYGYNQNEPESDYLTSDELVDSLVDIVSKNGNLLLDIGPRADGTIPELMASRLRDIGGWLDVNGEAIYGTTYFNHAEDDHSSVPIRYTVKNGSLYAISLEWPGDELTLGGDLPFGNTTRVRLLGTDEGDGLAWHRAADGTIRIQTPARSSVAGDHAYAFEINTPGVNQIVRTDLDTPSEVAPGSTVDATVTLTNTGSTASPDVRLQVAAPHGWTVDPSETVVAEIPAGDTVEVPVSVTVPATATRGEHEVTLTSTVGPMTTTAVEHVTVQLPNVALGKAATQKSLGWAAPASRAVDGNTNGSFGAGSVTHTAEPESQAWWQVDLGSSYPIEEIAIWNRSDCCAQRLSDYWVMVSDNPITGDSLEAARTAPEVTAVHQLAQAGRPTTLDLDGLHGRYVRIQLESATNPLSLAEVQVRAPAG
jgi:alpha-L-fucosidase